MTVIVVSFGYLDDPYTCSCTVDDSYLNDPNMLLQECCNEQHLAADTVDEILPIVNNEVAKHYSRANEHFSH